MSTRLLPAPSLRLNINQWVLLAALATVILTAACSARGGTSPGAAADPDAIDVVATTSVLADLVQQVGGSHVAASSLVPPGGEVHTFDPTPADIARVADAELIVTNGLGLDDWVADLARDSGTRAPILVLGEDLKGVTYLAGDGPAGTVNPHLWMDVRNASRYAVRIGDELPRVDPTHAGAYEAATKAYTQRLTELDAWARERIGAVPEARRKVVSFHDALPYFADAYGVEIVGTVIDAPGQDPSAGEVADLIEAIRETGASALFGEAQFNPDLARTIADEAGITVVTDLHTDSLGNPPADTYEGLIRSDVDKVVEALRP